MRITKLRPRVLIHYFHLAPGVLTQNPKFKVITKPKPQCFEGSEDLDEYLAQFEILSKLNRWDYHQKSLHLASS